MTDPEKNKEAVLAYLDTAFNEKRPAEAVERYGGPYYIQHNPQAPDGFGGSSCSWRASRSSSPGQASRSGAPWQRAT